jgi:hypothetical protein
MKASTVLVALVFSLPVANCAPTASIANQDLSSSFIANIVGALTGLTPSTEKHKRDLALLDVSKIISFVDHTHSK